MRSVSQGLASRGAGPAPAGGPGVAPPSHGWPPCWPLVTRIKVPPAPRSCSGMGELVISTNFGDSEKFGVWGTGSLSQELPQRCSELQPGEGTALTPGHHHA